MEERNAQLVPLPAANGTISIETSKPAADQNDLIVWAKRAAPAPDIVSITAARWRLPEGRSGGSANSSYDRQSSELKTLSTEDDRYRARLLLLRRDRRRTACENRVRRQTNQFSRVGLEQRWIARRKAVADPGILALDPPQSPRASTKADTIL
jgi:hypothetical protein